MFFLISEKNQDFIQLVISPKVEHSLSLLMRPRQFFAYKSFDKKTPKIMTSSSS